jgi:hypothetical protein
MGEINSYKILVGKPEEKRTLRSRHRCEHNITMNLEEMGQGGVD